MRSDYASLEELPAPSSTRLIDFEHVEIMTLRSLPPQFVLVVSGTKPLANMEVTLNPMVFVRQPEYWGIEVVGRVPGEIVLPAQVPYSVSIPLAGITGTQGIEVIGANRTERIDIDQPTPGEAGSALTFSRDDRPVDGVLRELTITPQDEDTFAATLRTARFDRLNGEEVDETEELAAGLTCAITDAEVRCSRDERPVDGALKELVVSQTAEGMFDATLRTAFFDRVNGGEVDETEELGAGLTRE